MSAGTMKMPHSVSAGREKRPSASVVAKALSGLPNDFDGRDKWTVASATGRPSEVTTWPRIAGTCVKVTGTQPTTDNIAARRLNLPSCRCRITDDALWRVTHAPTGVRVPESLAACGPDHSSGWLCNPPRRQPGRPKRAGQPARTPGAWLADEDQVRWRADRTTSGVVAPMVGALDRRGIGLRPQGRSAVGCITDDALWRVTHAPTGVRIPETLAACGPVHSSGWLCPRPAARAAGHAKRANGANARCAGLADERPVARLAHVQRRGWRPIDLAAGPDRRSGHND